MKGENEKKSKGRGGVGKRQGESDMVHEGEKECGCMKGEECESNRVPSERKGEGKGKEEGRREDVLQV